MLPSDLPPLLRGIRRDAVGTPMPSRSLRVTIETTKKVESLTKRLSCSQSDLLRLALRVGLERIEEALDDEEGRTDEERIESVRREVVLTDA